MSKELVGVQYLRGIAAILVVLHHLYFSDTQLGPFGVKIFFVISGFVMWYTTVGAEISPSLFWRRRLVRIVPLYWLFLSLLVAVVLTAPQYLKSTVITPDTVIKSFLFIPHYHAVQKFIAPILIPGWSLDYEIFFYFVFGIALLVKSVAFRAIAIGLLLGCLVLTGFLLHPQDAIAVIYTSPELLLFLDGIGLAIIYRSRDIGNVALGLILICIGVSMRSIDVPSMFGLMEILVGLAPALIVAGTLGLEPAIRRAPNIALHAIGNASYSIYLSHLFFLRLFEISWRNVVTFHSTVTLEVVYVAFALVFAIAGGVAVYYLLERPMLLLVNRNKVVTKPA